MGTPAEEIVWELTELHRRLRETIDGVPLALLDRAPADGTNSIAVLVTHALAAEAGWLHLAAGRGYKRDRASEFAVKGRGSQDLAREIDKAEGAAADLVRAAFDAGLDTERRRPDARPLTVVYCLSHAVAHVAEHVGHAELTKQLLIGGASGS